MKTFIFMLMVFCTSLYSHASDDPFVSIASECNESDKKVFSMNHKGLNPDSDCYTFCVVRNDKLKKCFPTTYEKAYEYKPRVNAVIRNNFKSNVDKIFNFLSTPDITLEKFDSHLTTNYKSVSCNVSYNNLKQAEDEYGMVRDALKCDIKKAPQPGATTGR